MKNLSNNKLLKLLMQLVFFILLAKAIAVALLWFLPTQTLEFQEDNSKVMPYKNLDFRAMIQPVSHKRKLQVVNRTRVEAQSIQNMILHGLYGNNHSGYAIVATKANPNKTEIISVGERYKGYVLKRIALDYVVFERAHREYILKFKALKEMHNKRAQFSYAQTIQDDAPIAVPRNNIQFYEKNPSHIWKDIAIDEIRKNGKIIGFKVKKVRKKTRMATLGLQSGDIILKANGIALTSYNKAFKIYKDINKLESLSLTIKRGNEEKELIYEIH